MLDLVCDRPKAIFISHGRHSCSFVAASCKKSMHETVAEEMGFGTLPKEEQTELWKEVIKTSFARVDVDIIGIPSCSGGTASCCYELQTPKCDNVGSTAVVTVFGPEVIVVANAGDSWAVLCQNGKVMLLSDDHKPDRPAELQRIKETGGRVSYWDGATYVLNQSILTTPVGGGVSSLNVRPAPEGAEPLHLPRGDMRTLISW